MLEDVGMGIGAAYPAEMINILKNIQLGPNIITAKKTIFTNKIKWFDGNGMLISEDKIKAILGWMATAPNKE